jgi:hypothetical protein
MIGGLERKLILRAFLWSFLFYCVPVVYGHADFVFLGICMAGAWRSACSLEVKIVVTALALGGQAVSVMISYAMCKRDDKRLYLVCAFFALFIFFFGTWVTWSVMMSRPYASIQETFFK